MKKTKSAVCTARFASYFASVLLAAVVSIPCLPNIAQAMLSPVSINIVPPVEFPPSEFDVTGVRASVIWGEQRSVFGFDFGVIGNITDVTFVGLAVAGGFNITRGTTTVLGLQLAGITNVNHQKTGVYGAQLALGVNYNEAASTIVGFEIAGLANLSMFTDVYGVQIGLYNRAQNLYGLQLGLVNVATSLHGIQIGLMNFNKTGLFAVSPVLNIGF